MLTDNEKRQRMVALAKTFPSLVSRCAEGVDCGLDPWDAAKLATCAELWTSGQQQIVAFLLSVWNSQQELGGTFKLVDAMVKWDAGDREALVAWALHPFSF